MINCTVYTGEREFGLTCSETTLKKLMSEELKGCKIKFHGKRPSFLSGQTTKTSPPQS